jgi:hypothetical protein
LEEVNVIVKVKSNSLDNKKLKTKLAGEGGENFEALGPDGDVDVDHLVDAGGVTGHG